MAARKQSPMEFLIAALKRNRKASYADIASAAAKRRLKLYPIIYGRAQALLGIVKSGKGGKGKARAAGGRKRRSVTGKRGPGRPRKTAAGALDSIHSIANAVRASQVEQERLRRALERIQQLVEGALS